MNSYQMLADSVHISSKDSGIELLGKDPSLELIGTGRSAFAFRIKSTDRVIKVFFPPFHQIAQEEAEVYKMLPDHPYFPNLYEAGPNFIVIDYIEGYTFFDCLVQGIPISDSKIKEVDEALSLARKNGLNPSDIHLRNIFITTDGNIKIIDVARFRQTKNCTQWNDLKYVFHKFYRKRFFPKRIPAFLLNMAAAIYKKEIIRLPS